MGIVSNGVVSPAAAHSGAQGLSLPSPILNAGWYRRSDVNLGLAGDRVSQWVRITDRNSRAYLGFSASATGAYALAVAPNTGELIFQRNPGYDFIDVVAIPFTWQLNKWYRLEVTWLTGTQVEGQVYDSDGSTLLAGLRMTAPLTPGGVAIRGFGGSQIDDLLSNGYAPTTITTGSVGAGLFCANRPFTVPFTVTGDVLPGNVFSVQLSNAAGSFTAPTTIGTLAGTTSGTIFATIPLGTPVGSGYRVRVVSSNPAVTGTDNGSNINLNSVSVLAVPANQTVATAAGQCSAVVSFAAATTNQATIEYTLNGNPITSPYNFPVGVNTVTVRAVNVCGTANGSFTVTVQDRQAPTIRAAGFITALESSGTRTIEAADVDWGSTDCSGIASMTISPRTFTCANVGPNNVTLTVTDGAGNSASETVTVFITADATCTAAVATASKATSSTAALGEANQLEAYPNPAKEQATLRFKATQTGPAQVQVYNSLGRLVATLYNDVAEQGRVYERTFTSTSLPAGLYTCRFIQQDKSVTRRLVISK
jgi:hypothetical protein